MGIFRSFAMFAVFLALILSGYGFSSLPSLAATEEDKGLPVGALAWIEPKSHVIKIGAPNVLEGARVGELYVREGDLVKKGQVLGVFSTYIKNNAAFDVADANVALAKANLEKVKLGNKQDDILFQKQTVQSLRAEEDAAISEFKRLEELYKQNLAAKSQYDAARAHKDSLIAQRKASEATLSSVKQVRPDDIVIAEANVKVAEAQLNVARADVDLSTIVAPVDGTILTVYARNSEAVGDLGVMDVADLSVMDVVAEVYEDDILRVRLGQKAEITVLGTHYMFSGVVREMGGQIKRNTVLDSDSTQILDNRVVEVRVELDKNANAVAKKLINKKVRVRISP